MTIQELKGTLSNINTVAFELENGEAVPAHFHLTELGLVNKNYIDCGGTVRNERYVSLQLWTAEDFDHRLAPAKFLNIIESSEKLFDLEDLQVEVEYQQSTIGRFALDFKAGKFILKSTMTDCLAKDNCGIPESKPKVKLSELQASSCCDPKSGCC